MQDGGARALRAVRGDAQHLSDPVGDPEADAEHAGQLVRMLADHAVRAVAVRLADPGREVSESMGGEQQVQAAGDAELLPGAVAS